MRQGAKIIVVMPAYNAEKTLERTIRDIPSGYADEIILCDDCSHDGTVALAKKLGLTVVVHPLNKGYGANQKTCYEMALQKGADIIVMVHPDYQYDPRVIPFAVGFWRRISAMWSLGREFVRVKRLLMEACLYINIYQTDF